ncbi:hypothetical protein [Demequina activiva]|nr:hypothetical protein [Demequina activiva]
MKSSATQGVLELHMLEQLDGENVLARHDIQVLRDGRSGRFERYSTYRTAPATQSSEDALRHVFP